MLRVTLVTWGMLLLLSPLPMLLKMTRFLWEREQYQFFPLMIVGAILLAVDRWQDLPAKNRLVLGSSAVSTGLIFIAILLMTAATLLWVQALAGLATIFLLAAIAWRLGGWIMLRVMGPSLVLLLTILPPPGGRDQTITLQLQQLAVGVSSQLLDVLHVPHVKAGNVLEIPGKRLLVEQACSGINSLMAVLAFSLLFGFWKQRSIWRIILLLPAAGFFVVCGNIVRITTEAWLKVKHNIDVLEGTKHQLMGLALFIGCVGLVISFDSLLEVIGTLLPANRLATARRVGFFARFGQKNRPSGPSLNRIGDQSAPAPTQRNLRPYEWTLAILLALSAIWLEFHIRNAWLPATVKDQARFELPSTLAGWEKVNKNAMIVERPQSGANTSFVWQYHRGDLIASVAIDYPFTGYHELAYCYATAGWNLLWEDTINNPAGVYQQAELSKSPDQSGYLLFNLSDERGRSVNYTQSFSGSSITDRLNVYRWIALGGATYQVQVMAEQYGNLSPQQKQQTANLYLQARQTLIAQLKSQLDK